MLANAPTPDDLGQNRELAAANAAKAAFTKAQSKPAKGLRKPIPVNNEDISPDHLAIFKRFEIPPFSFDQTVREAVLADLEFGEKTMEVIAEIAKSPTRLYFVEPETLSQLNVYSQSKDGYQRKMARLKVMMIATLASLGLVFPPILVARVEIKGRKYLYIIDGHHRACGCQIAGKGLYALEITCNLDELARWLYLIHNTTATKVGQASQRGSSWNPQAAREAEIAEKYGANSNQVMRVFEGIRSGNAVHPNYLSLDHGPDAHEIKLAETILDIWTESDLFKGNDAMPKRGQTEAWHRYSSIGVMQVLGMMAKDRKDDIPKLKEEITALKNISWKAGLKWANKIGSGQGDVGLMKVYVDTQVLKGKAPKGRPSDHGSGARRRNR